MRLSGRIAFYTDASAWGGAELSLATLLRELDPRFDAVVAGVEAAVVDRVAAEREGTRSFLIPRVRSKRDIPHLVANVRGIHATRCDVFHASLNAPYACQYALAACAALPSVRTVAVEHSAYPSEGRLKRHLKRFNCRRLAAHVAVGHAVARGVETLAGLAPGSIRTIHNGAPDLELRPLPRSHDGPVVGSLARLDGQKGFDVLLRSLVEVPEARLVLVGDGDERAALERLADELGVRERVQFEGWQDEARRYLTTFDVFVLPSRFEAFPLSIIEAMLARLPVVATRVGSVGEAVSDGKTGLLVPPGDPDALARALRELLGDPDRRREMGMRGRERAHAFNPQAMARAFEALYEEILA